ncbi:MAG: hypothetical protein M1118_06825 [Chloroflexi bacterium]|nr:hypothetical protein [Chloroflexota bacterium]
MTVTVTVAGYDLSAFVDVSSVQVTQVLTRRGDTAQFDVLDTMLQMGFLPFQRVTVTDGVNTKFGGVITRARQMASDGPSINRWRLYCQDDSYYLQHTLANKKYSNTTVDAIVKDLLVSFPPPVAITTNNVQSGLPAIAFFNVHHSSLADAFDRLVKMSLASTYLMWDVDAMGDLHFFDQNHVPQADIALTDAVGAGGGWVNYRRDTFWYETDASQLANSVTFRGGTYLSAPFTDTWVGDGQQTNFPLSYKPDTDASAGGSIPTVTVGGAAQVVALDTGSGFGGNQCLVGVDQASQTGILRFATAPGSGVAVVATYVFDLPVIVRRQNNPSVTQYGAWQQYVVDTSVKTQNAAAQRAGAMLSQFAQPVTKAELDVDVRYVGTLGAGQVIYLVNQQLGIVTQMVITDCRITGQPGGRLQHQLQLAAFA